MKTIIYRGNGRPPTFSSFVDPRPARARSRRGSRPGHRVRGQRDRMQARRGAHAGQFPESLRTSTALASESTPLARGSDQKPGRPACVAVHGALGGPTGTRSAGVHRRGPAGRRARCAGRAPNEAQLRKNQRDP